MKYLFQILKYDLDGSLACPVFLSNSA